jgi:hypothetical protein
VVGTPDYDATATACDYDAAGTNLQAVVLANIGTASIEAGRHSGWVRAEPPGLVGVYAELVSDEAHERVVEQVSLADRHELAVFVARLD